MVIDTLALSKIQKPPIWGGFCILLRGRGQNANTYHISLELSYYDNSTVLRSGEELLPSVGESALKVAIFRTLPLKLRTPDDRLTLPELRQKRREARLNRAQEYQQLIDDNGWTRAELTRHLGVSLAWVTIVLKNVVGVDSRT